MIVLTIMHRITIIVPITSIKAVPFLRTSVEWFGDGLEPVPRLQAHPKDMGGFVNGSFPKSGILFWGP